jgi:hypothetical protein
MASLGERLRLCPSEVPTVCEASASGQRRCCAGRLQADTAIKPDLIPQQHAEIVIDATLSMTLCHMCEMRSSQHWTKKCCCF